MESRFGRDFSNVRIHADEPAAKSAQAINAQAYTVGEDIVFGPGRYSATSAPGRRLLAHELAHVVQQSGSPVGVQTSAIAVAGANASEQEAQIASEGVMMGHPVRIRERAAPGVILRQPDEPILTAGAAGGCGICFKGDVKAVGNVAHALIQTEFEIMYPNLLPQFPIEVPDSPNVIKKGIPDLIMPTPTGFQIGEIKPANPEGYFEGDAKIEIYRRLLTERYGNVNPALTIEPMMLTPPPPMPFVEPASLTCTQLLICGPSVRGVYGYLCEPPFSGALRARCRCADDRPPVPPPVPVRKKKEVEERERVRIKAPDPRVLVPVAVSALMAAAIAWTAKKALGRLAGPAVILAAIVLMARGAEASVGLEGDDIFESLFEESAKNGTPIPDDLKDAIKNDPKLKKIFLEAAQSGNPTEAQRKLGEELTRVVLENRDQFTDEELQELLKVTDENSSSIPNGPVTAEMLRRSLANRSAGGTGKGTDKPAPADAPKPAPTDAGGTSTTGTDTKTKGGGEQKGEESKEPPAPDAAKSDPGAGLPAPAKRLVEAVVQTGGAGPKVTEAALQQLRTIVQTANPPLTDAEVDELISKISAAPGKTIEEVLESVRHGITQVRQPKATDTKTPAGTGTTPPDQPADLPKKDQESPDKALPAEAKKKPPAQTGKPAQKATKPPQKKPAPAMTPKGSASAIRSIEAVTKPTGKSVELSDSLKESFEKLDKSFANIAPNETWLMGSKDIKLQDGVPIEGTLVGRNEKGVLFFGAVQATPVKHGAKFGFNIAGGAQIIYKNGQESATKAFYMPPAS